MQRGRPKRPPLWRWSGNRAVGAPRLAQQFGHKSPEAGRLIRARTETGYDLHAREARFSNQPCRAGISDRDLSVVFWQSLSRFRGHAATPLADDEAARKSKRISVDPADADCPHRAAIGL